MYENSKLINFAVTFADGLERSYRYSYFCKWARSFSRSIKTIWDDSLIGQVIDSMFNIEAHRNSISYMIITKSVLSFFDFVSDKLSLEKGVSESKYVAAIKKISLVKRNIKVDMSLVKAIFKNSFLMRCLYDFWNVVD